MISQSRHFCAVLAMLQVCCVPESTYAQQQALREMDHVMWTARDGAPQAITELAQGRDGTLWIGSESGLYNFDGQIFRPFTSPPGQPELRWAHVGTLLVTKDGTLWAGFVEGGAARISSRQVTLFSSVGTEPLAVVNQLREAPDGSIWGIANRHYLIRFGHDGVWRREPTPSDTRVNGIYIDTANTLWLAQDGVLHRRPLAGTVYTRTNAPAGVVFAFAETPEGDLWMTDYDTAISRPRMQLIRATGRVDRVLPLSVFSNGRVIRAPDGSLITTSVASGVRRFSSETSLQAGQPSTPKSDIFAREHGLSSNAVRAVSMDSHGNIWLGGLRGLDRLRPAQLKGFVAAAEGSRWSVCATRRQDVWIATSSGVYPLFGSPKAWLAAPDTVNLYAVACADDGRAWFADSRGVWSVVDSKVTALPSIAAVPPFGILNIAAASDHTVYATVAPVAGDAAGVWRYQNARWTKFSDEGGIVGRGLALYVDTRDRLWVGHSEGRAVRYTEGKAQVFSSGESGLGQIFAFLDGARGLFAAGTFGLAVLREDRFEMLTFAEPSFVRGLRGIVEAGNGDIWLNAARGFVHIPAGELQMALATPAYPLKARLIKEGDFAGAMQTVSGHVNSAVRGADGRLWFATRHGIVHLDPERFTAASHLPILTIRSMMADGQPITASREVDAATRALEVQYFGANLSAPENVIYRYRLENYDESWQDAGRRTEAIFTRLPPGTYTFSVIASNGDGIWTPPVSSAPFTVLPRFYQTWWFAAGTVALATLIVGVVHRMRVRQIARVMNARFDERLAERTRVARELHDTLLQTVHGSKLVADRALRDTSERDRLVRALEQLSVWLGQAASEGRAALQSLRASTTETNDLAGSFRRALEECRRGSSAEISFSVQGRPRELHPVVRDEVYRIGYEAIRNACVHARATRIAITLEYDHDLTLRIDDNGVGIDPAVIEAGKEGHFGLRGMRERAERIGARFTLASDVGSGTTITLIVPGHSMSR